MTPQNVKGAAVTADAPRRSVLENGSEDTKTHQDIQAQSNRLDPVQLAIQCSVDISLSRLNRLEYWAVWLAELVEQQEIEKPAAVDMLWFAAVASNLHNIHGADEVQVLLASAFEGVPQ